MTKKTNLFVAIASLMLATSCSENQDVMGGVNLSNQTIQINPSVGHPSSRAVETNVSNLGSFSVSAFQASQANHMDKVLYSNKGGAWTTDAGKFFWPVEGDLHFYAYAPEVPGAADAPGTYEITSSSQKLANFSPCATAAEQKDFVYAYAKGNLTSNGTSGVDVDFKHALTEVSIAAKNDNSAYTVEVTGVKLGNIKSKGTFTFPAVGGATPASWNLSGSGAANYETTWTTANKLGKTVSSLDAKNVAFMLLPQQLATNTKASAGNYIALKVKITMQGGEVLHNDWAYIGIDTNWEMGKHYTYTLDFTSGAGQTEAGKMIISGKDIKLNVSASDWTEEKPYWQNEIKGKNSNSEAFTIKIDGVDQTINTDASGNWSLDLLNHGLVKDASMMFTSKNQIRALDLTHFNTSNVTTMYAMFAECGVSSLNLSEWNTSSVTDMSLMFQSCSLTSLNVSGWNTSSVTDMSLMFDGCSNLTSLNVSGWNTSSVTDMSDMFRWCSSLMSLDLSGWDTSNVTNMSGMFRWCSSLTSLDLSGWDTSNVTNMSGMFFDCSSLTTLDLSGWDFSNYGIWQGMFSGCKSLKTIKMIGCNQKTIQLFKEQLMEDGITGVNFITE